MKLYTEEQVNKIALQVKDNGYWNHLEITPIKLPSDEELEVLIDKNGYHNQEYDDIFRDGARWIIEQLKNK